MVNKTNRVISLAMSAALMLTNMIAPMTAYAEEVTEAANEAQMEEMDAPAPVPETQKQSEAQVYALTLPYCEEISYQVDQSRVLHPGDGGSQDILLGYHANEKVEFSFTPGEMIEVTELHLYDGSQAEEPFSIDNERRVSFFMPEKDLVFVAVPTKMEISEQPQDTENPGSDDMSSPAGPAMDEPSGSEDNGFSDGNAIQEAAGDAAPEDGISTDVMANADGAAETAVTDAPGQAPDIALTALIEEDGLPAQGSIMTVDTLLVPLGSTAFDAKTNLTGISYGGELDRVTLISDEVNVNVPGTYSTIYRVSHDNGAKMWYVLRPVVVDETALETEQVSEGGEDDDEDAEENAEDEDASHPGEEGYMTEKLSEVPEGNETGDGEEHSASLPQDALQGLEAGTEQTGAIHNIFFDTDEGYTIQMANDQVTFQEGEDVSFTVTAKEKYAIRTALAFVAMTGEDAAGVGEEAGAANGGDIPRQEDPSPVLITDQAVEVKRTSTVTEEGEAVEAVFEFEMPSEDVVLMASVDLAASAANDVTVQLSNGSVRNIPKSWTPDGVEWARGSAMFGYSLYRTVVMPDGKERKAYCLQPSLMGDPNGSYTATEVRKKGKLSEAEATLLRKALFYCYGGPGWSTGEVKNVLSDCSENDEYYVATHYILGKIYCDATTGDWNIAAAYGEKRTAMNARGVSQVTAAVAKIKSLPDPDATLSPTQVAGVYNETTGFAETQAVTFSTNVTGNNLTTTLPAGVYLTVGDTTYSPGQKAQIPANTSFVLKKNGYEAAHQETLTFKAAVFTDFDAYMINVDADHQNLGFSYVADKGFELLVNWPDLLTYLNIVKQDSHTGTTTPTDGYSMDGAVYGIYADAGKSQLLEQLTISGGMAVSSDNYVIGRTYYVAEISAPAEYQMDPAVYPVMAVAGGTATVTSNDTPKAVKVSVQKVDKETGESVPQAKGLSFEGAVFGIFSDEACTVKAVDMNGNAVPDIRTDANGHAETAQSLLIGNYYVKELAAPEGYLVNDAVFTVSADQVRDEIVNMDSQVELACEEQVIRANLDLMKVRTMKGLTTQAAEGVAFTFTYVNDPTVTFSVTDGMDNTVITDAEGFATTASDRYPAGTLIYGEWEITESNTPEGFESLDPTRFMIAGNGRTYRFVANNRQIHAAVLIEKHDANTGSRIPVAGVRFQLFKDGELVKLFNSAARTYEDTWVTDADGMVQLPEMVDYGTYVVKEDPDSIPDGYFVMDDASFTVDEMADDYMKPITLTADEPPQMGNILVEKRDAKTDEVLSDFTFEISVAEDITDMAGVIRTGTDADGNEVPLRAGTIVDRIETGKNGNAVSKDLFLGSYAVREMKVKNGYAITKETQNVTIKGDAAKARNKENVSEYVLFANHPTTVKLLKVSSKTGEALEGITFLVHKLQEGEAISDYAYAGQEEPSDGVILAGESADEGEAEAADAMHEPEKMSEQEENITDEERNGQESGLDETAIPPDELYVTDENGQLLVEYLDAGSTYVIREVKTIPGYNLSHELASFDVDSEGLIDGSHVKEVTMENDPNRIHISKTDITNSEEIPGALLTITDSEGNVIDEWTSGYEVHEVDALPAGTYVLTEVTAPDGYEEAESVTFTVINSRKIQKVVMKDSPFREVEVSKTDITGEKEIIGARLTITDKDGQEIESWESTADVHSVKLHSGEYILTETKPADGYVTAESVPFTVIRTSATDYEVMGVTMKDDVTKLEITKSDITNAQPVIGAELTITDKDGREVAKWTSTKDPYYIEMLPIGTYTLTEVSAPDGYATAESVTFEVADTAEIQKVDMKDAPVTVEISKKDIVKGEEGKELPGAKLEVRDEGGTVIEEWVSEKTPHKIAMLKPGKYTLTEVTAPKGYEVAEKVEFEVRDSGEVQHVVMYDSPKDETVDLTGKKKTTTSGSPMTQGIAGAASVIAQSVKTGDYNRYIPAILLIITGGATLAGLIAGKRKKKTKEN